MKTILADVNSLYFQYVPNEFIKDFYPGDEKNMLSVCNSPHYRFLVLYQKIGSEICNPKIFNETDYIRMMIRWNRDGNHNKWKVNRFIETYESIKQKGLLSSLVITKTPLHYKFFEQGYEICHGHHRSACCLALNIYSISCFLKS